MRWQSNRRKVAAARRFPALAAIPRVVLSTGPTPVEHADASIQTLWIKRDDVFADHSARQQGARPRVSARQRAP
jgi:hypothetical protein